MRFRAGSTANMMFWCPMVRGAAAERAQVALGELAAYLRAETGLALRGWGTSA